MNTISAPEGDSVISQILAAYELPGTCLLYTSDAADD